MKQCPYIKHPNGLAVDIGVNSSGLNPYQVEEVKKALERKGLYVYDERSYNEPCIHVSRSMKWVVETSIYYKEVFCFLAFLTISMRV